MPRRGRESGCREGAFWLGDSEQGRNNPLKSPSGQTRGDGLMEQLGYIVIYPSVAHHSGSLTPACNIFLFIYSRFLETLCLGIDSFSPCGISCSRRYVGTR